MDSLILCKHQIEPASFADSEIQGISIPIAYTDIELNIPRR